MDSPEELFRRLEQLNEIGAALSSERNLPRLLEQILVAAKAITHADGGTLYRMTEDRSALRFEIVCNDTLGIAPGNSPAGFHDLPLHAAGGSPNKALVAVCAVLEDRTINVADAYAEAGFDFSGTREFDARTGYRSRSFLTVPLKNHEGGIIGVLQLINAKDPMTGEIRNFPLAAQRLAESLASQAAIALTNRQLINQLEALFESFISLINLAIDEKSPYTGGHCQRVPRLTMMIAEAVNATREGPLADFTMSEAELYALKIAGLLHDCGKVTTPVHVVDKATKLQTIYDRIGLVDTRFEVLKRDALVTALHKQLELRPQHDPNAEALCWGEYRKAMESLDDDRAFLRQANRGCEEMPPEQQQRVRDIGTGRSWRNPAGVDADFLSADEIENLTIRSGTLTATERETINHHIVATIRMLESLPWPKHLEKVPEYAGGHHERMDGKGYPRGLTREQMSIPARIMAIADIFEALTAHDRPYKHGMQLSQALEVLRSCAENGHIDPEIFRIFIAQKVYKRYAAAFLEDGPTDP